MAGRLFRSRLGKTTDGYRWELAVPWLNKNRLAPRWFLTDGKPSGEPSPQEWSDPLHENPEAFLEFASLDYYQDLRHTGTIYPEPDSECQTPTSIGVFANRHGLL